MSPLKTKPVTEITRAIARKVLKVVDAGLVAGIGDPEPGKMCVEAAVCYALGLPHDDNPACVAPVLRSIQIRLNDSNWSSDRARAKGLRRLALAQLGSAGSLDESEFIKRVLGVVIRKTFPVAFRAVAAVVKDDKLKAEWSDLALRCEAASEQITPHEVRQFFLELIENAASNPSYSFAAVYAATAYDYADAYAVGDYAGTAAAFAAVSAYAAAAVAAFKKRSVARDKSLAAFCEKVVQVLIEMKAPGCQWLDLAPLSAAKQ